MIAKEHHTLHMPRTLVKTQIGPPLDVSRRRGGPASQGPELPIGTGVPLKAPKALAVSDPRTPAPRSARTSHDSARGLSPFACSAGARAARWDGVQSGSASPPAPPDRGPGPRMVYVGPAACRRPARGRRRAPSPTSGARARWRCEVYRYFGHPGACAGRLGSCFLVSFGTLGAGHIVY